ncbi:hypothetical protein JCM17823_29290 [Halorubrum gandharaense]
MPPECPDCGGDLVVGAAHEPAEGVHRVYECNACGTMYELTDVTEDRRPPEDPTKNVD